ncbi:MAG: SDR family oxidoreductase [Desulfobacterales bacterium]|jgi:NAD(P)-dependent dehydrogenase (short-subunit alcohol dehydrogenase family)|nr:SDR family oxidoreductase [Desulfobacteraceae bacterium]MBT4365765.1 SDR family oxidoreductase [Desulfobacteraceae bacterium]MBT7085019.1 SDR family oxidoreductase [Desulfobacterales bacterium]MBT7698491.1 SDR family oxidoreductase [Desulfobacterales bacterium]
MQKQTIPELFNLKGKTAIVTGSGMGIGEGIALRLGEAGADVLVTDINMEAAELTVEKICNEGGNARAIHADSSSLGDSKKVVREAVDAFGRLDILVNNAGKYFMKSALSVTEEMWDDLMDINLKGLFFNSQAAAQEMIKAGNGGRIINIASKDAFHPTAKMAPYDASKGGVAMVTKTMALELAPHNILVNAIVPGAVVTPGAQRNPASKAIGGEPRVPLKRLGTPDDIARAAIFLASNMSEYITGTMVVVDGGFLIS